MKLVDTTLKYAQAHLQAVRVCWLDREPTVCDALQAVELCADRGVAPHIMGVVSEDKRLESLLHQLIDRE